MKKTVSSLIASVLPTLAYSQAVSRFPKPDFQTDYVRPVLEVPGARSAFLGYIDIFVLIAALSLASYLALKARSRVKMFILVLFSLAYFGFFRKGCICAVGAVQNVSLAVFDPGYAIPLTAIVFFVLPLVFTLFFGRTFCAAVCPLGMIQDVVVLKPAPVRSWAAEVLGMIPYIYLGFAVLFAATGAGFIICRYDPFVGFFRFGASSAMIVLGVSMLILGTVIARPYCRFLCPYGVLLKWMSKLSKWHVTISPSDCNNCRLCEESCPYGAIQKPTLENAPERRKNLRTLGILLALLPLITFGTGWVVSALYTPVSNQHFTVSLAKQIYENENGRTAVLTEEAAAFLGSERTSSELYREAAAIRNRFKNGGWFLGAFLGLIGGMKLIGLSTFRKRTIYSIDNGDCFSCARCFSYCPVERNRLTESEEGRNKPE